MRHSVQLEGYGVRLRPVRMEDAAFIVWLRNLRHAKGRIGDSAEDVNSQVAWLKDYFERTGDYYFIIETPGGIPIGTQGVYAIEGDAAEVGRWVIRPEVQAAMPSYMLILDYAFNELRMKQLRATTIVANRGVISLNKKVGFEQFRTEPAERVISGEPMDIVHCVLRAGTWFKSRERLRPAAELAERLVREWEQDQLRSGQSPAGEYMNPPKPGGSPGLAATHSVPGRTGCQRFGMLFLLFVALALSSGMFASGRARGRVFNGFFPTPSVFSAAQEGCIHEANVVSASRMVGRVRAR